MGYALCWGPRLGSLRRQCREKCAPCCPWLLGAAEGLREALALSKQPRNVTHSYCLVHLNLGSVQSLCHVRFVATPWTAAHQASLSITNSQSLFKLMSIKLVMSSNHLILYHPLLLLPSIVPSIRVFSNQSVLRIR